MDRLFDADILPHVVQGLKFTFLLLTANLARLMMGNRLPLPRKMTPSGRRLTWLVILCLAPLFTAAYLYQASWQLTGFARPEFVDFMRRYNRRPVNPAREMRRGRLLDREGVVLASGDPADPAKRCYPLGPTFCHLVGYHDPRFGLSGIEAVENAYLNGQRFKTRDELDRFGRNILDRKAITGSDLPLTVHAGLQSLAVELLAGKRGAVVGIRPSDGALLVLVSSPGFDPNHVDAALFEKHAPGTPLFNRAIQGRYPPGSTFKIAMAAMAVEQGFNRSLDCPAEGFAAVPGAKPIRDHEYYERRRDGRTWTGHGPLSLTEAFTRSSNVFFARLGVELGGEALNEVASRWLFNRPLAIRTLTGELTAKPSYLPRVGHRERLEVAQRSIGQGQLLVTPLHMAVITAAIANDGLAMQPYVSGEPPTEPLGRIAAPLVAMQVQACMRDAVRHGTGHGADIEGLEVAGKTGTAQAPEGDDHSWFVCFAPHPRPTLALAVIVEHGGYGSRSAVPVAAALLRKARELNLLSPVSAESAAVRRAD